MLKIAHVKVERKEERRKEKKKAIQSMNSAS
jgi:hypothetical protein